MEKRFSCFCKIKELPVVPNFIRFSVSPTNVLFNIFRETKEKSKFFTDKDEI